MSVAELEPAPYPVAALEAPAAVEETPVTADELAPAAVLEAPYPEAPDAVEDTPAAVEEAVSELEAPAAVLEAPYPEAALDPEAPAAVLEAEEA